MKLSQETSTQRPASQMLPEYRDYPTCDNVSCRRHMSKLRQVGKLRRMIYLLLHCSLPLYKTQMVKQ